LLDAALAKLSKAFDIAAFLLRLLFWKFVSSWLSFEDISFIDDAFTSNDFLLISSKAYNSKYKDIYLKFLIKLLNLLVIYLFLIEFKFLFKSFWLFKDVRGDIEEVDDSDDGDADLANWELLIWLTKDFCCSFPFVSDLFGTISTIIKNFINKEEFLRFKRLVIKNLKPHKKLF